MLNNLGDIKNDVLVQLNASTTIAFYTDDILNDWTDKAHKWSAGFKKWPYTEGRISTTWTGSEESAYPEGWRADSIRVLQLGGKRLQKLNFEDYQIFREEQPDSDDRVFTDFGKVYFINPQVDSSGTTTAWGQFVPAGLDGTDPTVLTVFSGNDESGNEAIVQEVLSYAKTREKKIQEAILHHQRAMQILEEMWTKIKEEQFAYQTHHIRGGMWKRMDILEGVAEDELFRRDQFY